MQFDELLRELPESARTNRADVSVVLNTRVRLARNLEDASFPDWANVSQRRATLSRCLAELAKVPGMEDGFLCDTSTLLPVQREALFERNLVSRELTAKDAGAGVAISHDQTISVMINEEDHLRIQSFRRGLDLKRAWAAALRVESALDGPLNFAFDGRLGYLTSCPTNVGTGMRASALMHLPAIVATNSMEQVVRAVAQVGIVVRGFHGEGTEGLGSLFQISNQQTFGPSEEDTLRQLGKFLRVIVQQEDNARERLLGTRYDEVADQVLRAVGVLKHARRVTSSEGVNLLSLLRFASELGFFGSSVSASIDRWLMEVQPAHVQLALGDEGKDERERDIHRADWLRQCFATLPPLSVQDPKHNN